MLCMCGDSQCPSCGLAQGTLESEYVAARLTSRRGHKVHLMVAGRSRWAKALCGAKPGRLSDGWDLGHDGRGLDWPATCSRCLKRGG